MRGKEPPKYRGISQNFQLCLYPILLINDKFGTIKTPMAYCAMPNFIFISTRYILSPLRGEKLLKYNFGATLVYPSTVNHWNIDFLKAAPLLTYFCKTISHLGKLTSNINNNKQLLLNLMLMIFFCSVKVWNSHLCGIFVGLQYFAPYLCITSFHSLTYTDFTVYRFRILSQFVVVHAPKSFCITSVKTL